MQLFPKSECTFNLHLCNHLYEEEAELGSTALRMEFWIERAIGFIKKLLKYTVSKHIELQIMGQLLLDQALSWELLADPTLVKWIPKPNPREQLLDDNTLERFFLFNGKPFVFVTGIELADRKKLEEYLEVDYPEFDYDWVSNMPCVSALLSPW